MSYDLYFNGSTYTYLLKRLITTSMYENSSLYDFNEQSSIRSPSHTESIHLLYNELFEIFDVLVYVAISILSS